MKRLFFVIILSFCWTYGIAQVVTYSKSKVAVSKISTVAPKDIKEDYQPKLYHLEMPSPGSARYRLEQIKRKSAELYPRKQPSAKSWNAVGTTDPAIGKSFPVMNIIVLPDTTLFVYLVGGIPNDNTVAVSNAGLLVTSYNSSLYTYDTNGDSMLIPVMSLHAFSSEFTNQDKYDPKLLYDPLADRYIIVFLNGRYSYESLIIVGFSQTNDPSGAWNLYSLSGNPVGDTTWTDYPAIAITENELFITGNLLRDSVSWQIGFAQTIIWQVEKQNGYDGDSILNTTLWSDIKYNGENVRNLNPIQGGTAPVGSGIYLLSNKNFTIQSDTIFMVEITGEQDDISTVLNITMGQTDVPYGAPPNGRQSHVDSLATNDARVLGGFIENGEIQYVANTIDTATGYAGVYHGFITNLDSTPVFTGTILSDDSLDLAYPNIAYTGNRECNRQAIIAFDHTSPTRNPGVSAIQYNSNNTYSNLITLKEAESHTDRLGGYERWGDYSGIQRKYNDTGVVWTAGFFGRTNKNYTWIAEVIASPEDSLQASITSVSNSTKYGTDDGVITVQASGGFTPYSITWNDETAETNATVSKLKPGEYHVTITDAANCRVTDSAQIEEPLPASNIFPNPIDGVISIYFEMDAPEVITIGIYDAKGALIKPLFEDYAKQGSNLFTFSVSPLSAGSYILHIASKERVILQQKILKY